MIINMFSSPFQSSIFIAHKPIPFDAKAKSCVLGIPLMYTGYLTPLIMYFLSAISKQRFIFILQSDCG